MPQFPIEFKKCPNCGCEETTTREAYKQVQLQSKKPPAGFISPEKVAIALIGAANASGNTFPVIIHHLDYCASCGLKYCTRAEIVQESKPLPIAVPRGAIS